MKLYAKTSLMDQMQEGITMEGADVGDQASCQTPETSS